MRHEIRNYMADYTSGPALSAIETILGELLANVAVHTESGASIHIDWDGDAARLTVVDAGPGYEPDGEIGPPHPDDDHGYGLWLVRQLGRDLRVTRGPRGGTTVSVALPMG
jgi:anti-sigma regulatory factor (Ser/Thr protein kinase)